MTLLCSQIQSLFSHHLLALSKGNVVEVPVVEAVAHLLPWEETRSEFSTLEGRQGWGQHSQAELPRTNPSHMSCHTPDISSLLSFSHPLLAQVLK